MAASSQVGATATVSKADYLKRYLSGDGGSRKTKEKKLKKKRPKPSGKGMRIVDDDVDWKQFMQSEEKDKPDEEEEEAPVVGTDSRTISLETTLLTRSRFVKFVPFTPQVAEVIDERPDEVKRLEEFTNSNKWKTVGAQVLPLKREQRTCLGEDLTSHLPGKAGTILLTSHLPGKADTILLTSHLPGKASKIPLTSQPRDGNLPRLQRSLAGVAILRPLLPHAGGDTTPQIFPLPGTAGMIQSPISPRLARSRAE
ncbi:UNVERIFIED_CONTAM: hypothetical protein FKN15_068687 [Acipenser sinensis]